MIAYCLKTGDIPIMLYYQIENENNQIQQEEQEAKYREQQASIQNQMKAPSIPNMPNMDSISRGFTMPTLPKF